MQQAAVEGQADGGIVAVDALQVGDDVEGEHGKGERQLDDVGAHHQERGQPLRRFAGDLDHVEDERGEVEADIGGFPPVRFVPRASASRLQVASQSPPHGEE